jgi:hypothetical protein
VAKAPWGRANYDDIREAFMTEVAAIYVRRHHAGLIKRRGLP